MSTPARRKKRTRKTPRKPPAPRSPARELTVVLEDMRSHFKSFGEALQGLSQQVDARFAQVDARFDGVDREINLVKCAVLENSRELRDIRATKVSRDEVESIVERATARR